MSRAQFRALVASFFAGLVGSGAILLFINSMMIGPVTKEFGWGRGSFGLVLMLGVVANAVGVVITGRLADRYGIRRIVIPGILFYAAALASMSLATASTYVFLYTIVGLSACTQGPQLYAKVISAWFTGSRALALAIVAVGAGLGATIWPQYVAMIDEHYGWRGGWVGLGIAVVVVALPVCVLFLREPKIQSNSALERTRAENELRGLTSDRVLRTRSFWLITIAQCLSTIAFSGIIANSVLLFTERGVDLGIARGFLAAVGLGGIIGRLLSGALLDRFNTPRISILFFAAPLVALFIVGGTNNGSLLILAAGIFGLGFGSETEIAGYFFSRYFGLRAYAATYSMSFALFALGAGFGPVLVGKLFDASGNYVVAISVLQVLAAVSVVLMALLGPFVYDVMVREAAPASGVSGVVQGS